MPNFKRPPGPPRLGLIHNDGLVYVYTPDAAEPRVFVEQAAARAVLVHEELVAAIERLLDEGNPFQSDAESCECGDYGTGYDPEGVPCGHIQAHRALAKAKGLTP